MKRGDRRWRIVRHFRTDEGWDEEEIAGLDARLTVLGIEIPLARIYRNVDFADEASGHR